MESRRVPRVPIEGKIRYTISPKMRREVGLFQARMNGQLTNIGTLGVGIKSSVYLPRGARIHAEFPAKILGSSTGVKHFKFVGTVKNVRMFAGNTYHLGIEFEKLSARYLELIKTFVNDRLTKS